MSRRSGRGGRGGGRGSMGREEQISRALSKLLRHKAKDEGLYIHDDGYINLEHVLKSRSLRPLNITLPEIKEVVASNDKQRFSLIHKSTHASSNRSAENFSGESSKTLEDDHNPAHFLIRANQGHSIKLVSAEAMHTPITLESDSIPKIVVHGTTRMAWPLILRSGGLQPLSRTHVHFATGLPKGFESVVPVGETLEEIEKDESAGETVSGMRRTSQVLIYIDLRKALQSGLKFWMSQNGVVLCDGGEQGIVPISVFKTVEERGVGVLLTDGEVVGTLSKK